MSRSRSIWSTIVLVVGVLALILLSVQAVRVWQSQDLAEDNLGASTELADNPGDKPVQLWHEDPQAKPIPLASSTSPSSEEPGEPHDPAAHQPRFRWALTPRTRVADADVSPAEDYHDSPSVTELESALAEADPQPLLAPRSPVESPALADVDRAPALAAFPESSTDDPSHGDAAEAARPDRQSLRESVDLPESSPGAEGLTATVEDDAAAAKLRVFIADSPEAQPAVPRTLEPASPAAKTNRVVAWPQAQALRAALADLEANADGRAWASQVLAVLDQLEAAPSFASPEAADALQKLHQLSDAVRQQVATDEAAPLLTKLLRTSFALKRRLAIWQALHSGGASAAAKGSATVKREELAAATSAVDAFLAASGRQQEWRKFLLLDDALRTIREPDGATSTHGRTLARCILARVESTTLTTQQAKFLDRAVVHRWTALLRQWAIEPVDPARLLRLVEQYELQPTSAVARDIARTNQVLRWSTEARTTDLGTQLNLHYRNANMRVAVSADLINRLLPPLRRFDAPVDDVIRNTRVVGHSQTAARSRVVLFPDRQRWSLGLDVLGSVASETQGQRGPAVFFQDGQARFHARKLIHLDHQGLQVQPSFAVAESASQLTGLETDFDSVPLMNRLARSIAQRQYEGESGAAQSEVEERIASEASQRLDEEAQQLLKETRDEFDARVLRPLTDLGLEPTPIDFETTRARLIARYRLAGTHQLAAHSPRPQAPANSLLSVQVHESALNNVGEQLRFNGRQADLPELIRELAHRLGQQNVALPEELPENVRVQFTNEEAVRVVLNGGRVTVTLQVAELSQGRDNRWKNFVVRAHYVPQIHGRQVSLVRDGVIELGGDRRRIGDQVALRGIFAKVLSKNRPIPLLPSSLVDRRELSDVEASQAVVEDGWIGITLAQGGSVARQRGGQPQR